jgi:hypothetical protein
MGLQKRSQKTSRRAAFGAVARPPTRRISTGHAARAHCARAAGAVSRKNLQATARAFSGVRGHRA